MLSQNRNGKGVLAIDVYKIYMFYFRILIPSNFKKFIADRIGKSCLKGGYFANNILHF